MAGRAGKRAKQLNPGLDDGGMVKTSDVDVVFSDWSAALERINTHSDSPRDVRRNFSQLIDLSQKLTSVMRKEFPGKWEAKRFQEWSEVTELFKELRNYEQHEQLLQHHVEETSHLTVPAEDGWPKMTLGISGTLKGVDPLAEEKPRSNIALVAADPETGRMTNREIGHVSKRTHRYILAIAQESERGRKINRLLERIGTNDVHALSEHCNKTLTDYLQFYRVELENAK